VENIVLPLELPKVFLLNHLLKDYSVPTLSLSFVPDHDPKMLFRRLSEVSIVSQHLQYLNHILNTIFLLYTIVVHLYFSVVSTYWAI